MPGGELFYHLRKDKYYLEDKARFYVCELVLALEYLHNNNCIYRDLKPENILLYKDGHIKLTYFGLSKMIMKNSEDYIEEKKAYTICGTPEYLAPEILEGKGHNKSVDWWSLGAVLYEMLVGFSPFLPKDNKRLDIRVYLQPVDYKSYLSKEAVSLINGLLKVDAKERLGSGKEGAKQVKSKSFFKNINWKDVENKKLKPPFVPKITGDDDYSTFDKVFTNENPLN